MQDTTVLNYLSATPAVDYRRRHRILLVIWSALALFIFAGVGPAAEVYFSSYATELPGITQQFLSFSRWIIYRFGWVVLLVLPWGLPEMVHQFARQTNPENAWRLHKRFAIAVVLGTLALPFGSAASLYAPFVTILFDLTAGSALGTQ